MNALNSIKAGIFYVLIFIFSGINHSEIFSQDTTKNNYTGDWEVDASWVDGTSPGTTVNWVDLDINGYITSNSDISFNNGLITVHDTLIIKGNFTLLNNGDLTVDSAGILIIFGDYLSYNQVQISNGGYFIVTGNFEMQGSDLQGSFDSDSGTVYIFDDTPAIKTGAGYVDLQCDNEIYYPDSCGYGSEVHIVDDPIFDFILEAGCDGSGAQPEISGSFEVYEGVGYSYTTTAGLNNYTWIVTDGTIVAGQGTNSVTVEWILTGSSDIKVIYDSAGCISNSNTYTVSVSSLPAECFSYRRQLTISNTVVNGGTDLTDFPYLVRIQDNSLRHIYQGGNITHPKGYDILFTQNADGTGILDHQTDYYDPATGTLYVWVKIPTLSASANTNIYLFYGNYNITSDLSTDAVFAGDYVAVYHMGESLRDYGPTANDGINNGTTTITGKIGLGRDFERDDRDYIFVTNEPDFRFDTTMTFSYWMYIESYPTAGGGANDWMDVLIKGDNVNFRLVCNRNSRNAYYAFGNGGFPDDLTSANNSVNPGTWIYVAGTWDGNYIPTNERKKLFINNVRTNMDPLGQDLSQDFEYNTHSVLLGINEEAPDTRAFDGIMDEVRISRGWRSDNWILTEYNNQNNPAAYITVGAETQVYTLSAIGGTVDVEDVTIQARDYTRAAVSGYTGTIQWQYSTDNIDFHDIAGETSDTLITNPLLETTYYRAFVTDAGCSAASTVDSVLIEPGFIDCEYNYRKKITISPDNVYGTDNMSNFPVLIEIQDNPDLRSIGQGGKVENNLGYDIAFTSYDGVTVLAHQVELYDSINGTLLTWVRVPNLLSLDSTYLYMYYGNPAIITDPSTSAVWSNDYIGVWHMGSDLIDATGKGNDGTNTGTGEVAGHIGNARSFNGSSNYVTIANESNFDVQANGKLTISGWIYVNSYTGGSQEQYITKGTDGWFLRKYGTTGNRPEMYHQYLAGQYLQAYNNDGINTGSWHYLAATFDHAINNMFVYIDGSLANSIKNDPAGSTITGNNNQVRFGADAGATPGNWFDGILDEVRIQSVSRTTDWIKTEHLNQINPSAFIIIQDEEMCITDPSPGTAYSEYSKVCQGQTTRIILTGSSGNIYWQSSTDSISWNYITGESDSVLTVGPLTDTMYYRASISYCCELFSNSVRIDYLDEVPPVLSFVFDSVNCPGGNDGSIDLTITGGAAPFDILWSTSSTDEDISGLITDYYSVIVTDNAECRVADSVEVLERNYTPLSVGNITGEVSSLQCYGYDPALLTINPSGGAGTYDYQWQSSPDGATWSDIGGATNATHNPLSITNTTHYRVQVDPTGIPDCETWTISDNTIVITILPDFDAGIITGETTATQCYSYNPAAMTANPSGGAGTYTYQWQSSPEGVVWTDISGATNAVYDPGPVTDTTHYRVMIDPTGTPDCGNAAPSTNTIVLTILPQFNPGAITGESSAIQCYNYNPATMTANPSGGSGTYNYQWQSSPDGSIWTDIGGETGATYDPGAITDTTYYRVLVDPAGAPDCGTAAPSTNNIVLTILPQFNPGAITGESSATQCYNYDPAIMSANPSGGSGTYNYQWQSSLDGSIWTDIGGETGATYDPGAITGTTHYRVLVDPAGAPDCGTAAPSSNTVVLTILPPFNPGAITGESSATQCYNYDPAIMTANPSGGSGIYGYQWQSSPDGLAWTDIGGETGATYNPGAITDTTHYRVLVDPAGAPDCGTAAPSSNTIVLTILPQFNPGIITGQTSATRCYNFNPAAMTANPTGGAGTYTYQWQSSPDGSAWTDIIGESGVSLDPGPLTATTHYRVMVDAAGTPDCGGATPSTNTIVLTILAQFNPGPITGQTSTTQCYNFNPGIMSANATGGSGTYNYQWQSSPDGTTWTDIGAATNQIYDPGPLTDTTYYRVLVDPAGIPDCGAATPSTNTVVITILPEFIIGTITGETSATQCYNYDPATMSIAPTGGSGSYTYQWQSSPDGSTWTDILGETNASYNPGSITTTTHYRVLVDATGTPDCGGATPSTNTIVLTILPEFSAGAITGETTATQCYDYNPAVMTSNPTGGAGTYAYQWQSSPDGTVWTDIGGETGATYDPGTVTDTIHYRVMVDATGTPDCGGAIPSTNTVILTILPEFNPGTFTGESTAAYCDNYNPSPMTANPSGGSGTYLYQWQSSPDGTAWTDIGSASGVNYDPGSITATTHYRVMVDPSGTPDCGAATPSDNTIAITINPLPTASIAVTDNSGAVNDDGIICSGDSATLTASGGTSYLWSSGESTAAIDKGAAGTYTVTVTDANGCMDNDAATIIVDPLLPVSVVIVEDQNNVCSGATVTFKASPTNGGTTPVYQWRVNGSPVGANSDTYVYSPAHLDSVTVELTSDEACATNNPAISNAIGMLVYSANPGIFDVTGTGTYCSGGTGLPVNLSGSELGVSYQLVKDGADDGSPVTGDGNPITWNNRTEGNYTVVATNGCGSSDMNGTAMIIIAGAFPALFDVTGTGSYCFGGSGLPVNLSSSELGVNYQLQKNGTDDGLPVIGDGNPVTWNDKLEGTYKVLATNGCGTSEMNDSAVITEFNTPPSGDANQIFCADNQTIDDLSATGTGILWYSAVSGGTPLDVSDPLVSGSTYYASQTVGGCESNARLSVLVTINPTPVTSAISGNSTPVCFEEDVTYSVTSSANAKYTWNVPADASITSDTTGIEKNGITVTFGSISGEISVVETNLFGCSGTEQILDIQLIGCYLEADFTADKTLICLGDTVTFTNLSQGTRDETQYQWSFGDAAIPQSATGTGPHEVTYGQTGLKTVRLIITDGLTDTLTLTGYISVNSIPSATILEESICGEGSVLFTIEDSPQYDKVEFSDDTTSANVDKDITPPYSHSEYLPENDSVMIWAKVYNTATGCASNWISSNWGKSYSIPDSITILNYLRPDADFQDYLDILCTNDSGAYTVETPVGSTITWNIPSLNIQDQMTETIQVFWDIVPGDYPVTAFEINIYGCQGPVSEAEVHISVPSVSLGQNVEICQGETQTFTTNETFLLYEWNDGSSLSSLTTGEEGIVKVTVTDEYGCTASDSAMLTVHERPVLNLGNDTVLCGTGAYRLEATGFNSYRWSTGEESSYIFVYSGQQTISLTVANSYGCSDTDTIEIIECSPVNLLGKITNAFTPNEDGNHDEWVINNIDLFPNAKIEVFDRWGRLVFSVDGGYKNDWKGTLNGKDLPVDNYYYVIDLKVPESEPLTGTLTIIR